MNSLKLVLGNNITYSGLQRTTARTFDLTLTEIDNWTGPDGVVKEKVMLINDQYPGPVLFADWGDTLVINVHNNMETNG